MLQVTETHSPLAPSGLEQVQLTHDEARALTDKVKDDAQALWLNLLRLYHGKAHEALRYKSWGAYFEEEFRELGGRRRAYQLLEAARVAEAVQNFALEPPENDYQARELVPLLDEPEVLAETWQEVRVRAEVEGKPVTAALVKEVVQEKRGLQSILGSSESNEWYTPARYIESARTVLGHFDLDPASCVEANDVVGADAFYTEADDGLAKSWRGRVWMNPPYGNLCGKFTDKLRSEYESGNVDEAILLVSAYSTETRWFQPLFDYTICFPDHRVKFWSPGRVPAPTFGPAFIYMGRNKDRFISEFSQYGAIVGRV